MMPMNLISQAPARSPRTEALVRAAESWAGTPFAPNSAVKGAGVSCHQLMAQIYREAGWLDLQGLPNGDPGHARAGNSAPMLAWLDGPGQIWFERLWLDVPLRLAPGDLLLVRYGHVPHHLAMMLPAARVVHVSVRHGVHILPVLPRRFAGHIFAVFRPK
jgi:cell wall-associated NlpC family hydrolase